MSGVFSRTTRQAVYIRAWFGCERCGRDDGLQVHHRRPRAMGGTQDAISRSAANALLLCVTCHGWVEGNRRAAAGRGWLVRQGIDPATVEVMIYGRGWVRLGVDGQYWPCSRRRDV